MTLVLELEQHRLLVDQLMAEEAISIELELAPGGLPWKGIRAMGPRCGADGCGGSER